MRNGLDIEAVTLGSSTFALVASDTSSASFLIPDTSFEIISLDLSDAYIFSKNSATKYAKAGDTLISRFAIDDTVVFTGGCWRLSSKIIVPDVPIEEYATFKAEVANAAKYTLTEDDIPSSEHVFVDTIRPNIEIIQTALRHYLMSLPANDTLDVAITTIGSKTYALAISNVGENFC